MLVSPFHLWQSHDRDCHSLFANHFAAQAPWTKWEQDRVVEVSAIAFAQCCHDPFALVVEYSFQNPPNINRVRRLRDVRTDEMQLPRRRRSD